MVDAATEVFVSPSDKARSCFMISAFCALLAFLGPLAMTFAVIANISSAAATPINEMVSMDTGPPAEMAGLVIQRIVR